MQFGFRLRGIVLWKVVVVLCRPNRRVRRFWIELEDLRRPQFVDVLVQCSIAGDIAAEEELERGAVQCSRNDLPLSLVWHTYTCHEQGRRHDETVERKRYAWQRFEAWARGKYSRVSEVTAQDANVYRIYLQRIADNADYSDLTPEQRDERHRKRLRAWNSERATLARIWAVLDKAGEYRGPDHDHVHDLGRAGAQ